MALGGGGAGEADSADGAGDVGAAHEAGRAGLGCGVEFLLLVGGIGDVVAYFGINPVGSDEEGGGDL